MSTKYVIAGEKGAREIFRGTEVAKLINDGRNLELNAVSSRRFVAS
jgi:hypothetical protein